MLQEVEEEQKKSGTDITVCMQRELVQPPSSHPSRVENPPKNNSLVVFFSPTLLNAGLPRA